jgi:hypothetical protein
LNFNIIEHAHNGVKYYEVNGVYFYVEPGLFKDISDVSNEWEEYAENIKNRPIYIFKSRKTDELMCSYTMRVDCEYETKIDDVTVYYNRPNIDFTDKNVLGFVRQCLKERRNYNVVCYVDEGVGGDAYNVCEDLTLNDFFAEYCRPRK